VNDTSSQLKCSSTNDYLCPPRQSTFYNYWRGRTLN